MVEKWRQPAKFLKMAGAELVDPCPTVRCQLHADDPAVVGVRRPEDETARYGPVHEFYRAVMSEQEVLRCLTDGRPALVLMTADDEEQLMVRLGQPDVLRARRAPFQETPQLHAEHEQIPILPVGELRHPFSTYSR